jgi:NADPH:quinone reductase-like Zn-dependent oxidoreductase/uncharacterized protein YndB with AHSA1/START domain
MAALQRVVRSTVIDAPIERVWAVLRDFNSHDRWHAVVEESRIEGGERSDQVGCVRRFSLRDGNRIREQLLELDDAAHRSTYTIVEATVPLRRYVATVTLKPVTDGDRTFWHWESTFATPPGMERELSEMVARDVYEAGFDNLRRYLQGQGGPATAPPRSPAAGASVETHEVRVSRYGGPEVLVPADARCAPPRAGEVRIRQRAIGVNFLDVYLRRGWIPHMLPLPGVPGVEAAGHVLDSGPGSAGFGVGDRVAYLTPVAGAYTGLRCVPVEQVVQLPDDVDELTAAALLLKGATADYLIRDLGRIDRGTRLLVHAAAGGVGLILCSWARHLGATVIGTVSSEEKARLARAHGCEDVVVTTDYRFADAVRARCGGADVIVDGLGDAAREENLAALAPGGHWISLGQASGPLGAVDPNRLVEKSATFSRPAVFHYVATASALRARAERVWQALRDGAIRKPPIERHALAAASEAHQRLETRRTVGCLVLEA